MLTPLRYVISIFAIASLTPSALFQQPPKMKNPNIRWDDHIYSGGDGEIRTLDTLLTYTHFPGVLLQPLGHVSIEASAKIKTFPVLIQKK